MNSERSGRDDTPWPSKQAPVRMVLARPDGTLHADTADTIIPKPGHHVPADANSEEAAAVRLLHLTAARDQLLRILVTLDEHCRSPAPATLDLAIHHLNREIE
jgi:hypothetical protein